MKGNIVAAHQTYFFPYIGYFTVMNSCDNFVHVDSFQFEKQSWMQRNRVLSPNKEWEYISVPVLKHHRHTPTNEVEINYDGKWEAKIMRQLAYYKKHAPFYKGVIGLVENLFSKKYDNIAELNMRSTDLVLDYLNMKKNIKCFSNLDMVPKEDMKADDWGLEITKYIVGNGTYHNAPDGAKFYDADKYRENGVEIKFLKNNLSEYEQIKGKDFVPGLSILDVMMFNSVEEINDMLLDYTFV